MDWFRTTRRVCPDRKVALITDLVDSEGHKMIVEGDDDIRRLQAEGLGATEIAKRLKIGRASVYRVLKATQPGSTDA